jgi:hypothetical protein
VGMAREEEQWGAGGEKNSVRWYCFLRALGNRVGLWWERIFLLAKNPVGELTALGPKANMPPSPRLV